MKLNLITAIAAFAVAVMLIVGHFVSGAQAAPPNPPAAHFHASAPTGPPASSFSAKPNRSNKQAPYPPAFPERRSGHAGNPITGAINTPIATVTATPNPCGLAWRVVASPNVGSSDSRMNGVVVVDPNDVWAVGTYTNGNTYQTLTEHWNGAAWSIVASPNVGSSENYLNAVAAAGPNDVWAVGYYYSGSGYQTLTEHWNGAAWSVVASPNPDSNNYLQEVSVVGPNDVWAVGYDDGMLTEHWNGVVWSVVASPSPGSSENYLNAVAAVGPNDVWAVGNYFSNSDNDHQAFAEHWNGAAWSDTGSLNGGSNFNYLNAVAAVGSSDVWAVGTYSDDSGVLHTLTEHWNGAAWNIVASPNLGSYGSGLGGATVAGPNDVWAIGSYNNGSVYQTLTEHWNGGGWNIVASPNFGSYESLIGGVAAVGPNDVWAVGSYYNNDNNYYTLTEHYNDPCVTPTPTSTETPGGPADTPTPTATPGGPTPTDCANPFVDINGNVFYGAIHFLNCRGMVNGTDASHYSPAGTSTRAQFAKTIVKGFGLSIYTPSSGQDFTDVPPSYWAYQYIETGFQDGILSGFDANSCVAHEAAYPCYLPNIPITRGQLTKLVVNAAHYPLFTPTSGQSFSDVPPSNVFYVSIETAHEKGIINGYPGGIFLPNQNILRDQMCQIVYKGVTIP